MDIQLGTANVVVTLIPFIVAAIVFPFILRRQKLVASGQLATAEQKKYRNRYILYYNNVFTRKQFRHVVNSFASLMCYSREELQKNTVKLFEKSVGIAIAIPLFLLVTFQDITVTAIAVIVTFLYYEKTVNAAIDKQIRNMSEELSVTMQSMADTYNLTHDVVESVRLCERDDCLRMPMLKMYEMLVAEDGESALDNFKGSTPVRLLSTLASTCHIFKEEGDVEDENGSSFVQKLSHMRKEADDKCTNMLATDIAFKSLGSMAITGLLVAPLFNMFLLSQIPGTSVLIKGIYGYVEMIGIVVITAVATYVISSLRRPSVVNQIDKMEIIDNISKKKKFNAFIKDLIPKSYKAQYKWKLKLNDAISSKNLEYIYTQKVLAFSLVFAASFIVLCICTVSAKSWLWNYYGSMSMTSSVEMTEEMEYQLRQVDKMYLTEEEKMGDEQAASLVKSKLGSLNALQVEEQVDRLSTKWDKYYAIGFKWYFVVIAFTIGLVGWFSPEIGLYFRKKLVMYEVAEDVMQIQSLMMTLQTTKIDVYNSLHWMAEESTIHKAVLRYACIEYPSDPELALQRLKDSVGSKDLKRIISKLEKAMFDLSIGDAFRDIVQDKQQSLITNRMLQEQMLISKKEYARMFATMPLNFSIYFGFMGPIFILGLQQLMTAFAQM